MKKIKLETIFGNNAISELGEKCARVLEKTMGVGYWIHSFNEEEKALANLMVAHGLLSFDKFKYFRKTEKGERIYNQLNKRK